jgi:ABC-type hemin transport system ATPase subunit
VFSAIKALSRSGVTVVLVEHKPELIAEFADSVVVLKDGRVHMQGPPGAVLAHPTLPDIGVIRPRYTQAAQAALARSLWPADLALPVTLEDAVLGFSPSHETQAIEGHGPVPLPSGSDTA